MTPKMLVKKSKEKVKTFNYQSITKGNTKMKKTRIIVGVLALAVVAAIVFACTKEKETRVTQSSNEMTSVSKEDDMSAYLKQFKEKMQSAEKGDEALSLDDARWYLEAVLNYTYGDAGHLFSDIQYDTFYYKLPVRDGEITFGQLNEAFKVFSNNVEEVYEESKLPEKRILAIQTKFNTDDSKGDGVSAQIIVNTSGIVPVYPWFDSTDYWNEWYYDDWYGYIMSGGKCGPYMGDCPESGAPLELTRKVNLRIPKDACQNGNGYYTDVFSGILSHQLSDFNQDFLDDENSPCTYKLYYRTENPEFPELSNPGGCICPEDMNYYLSKGPELIYHYKPEGMSVISAFYRSEEIVCSYTNCFHDMVLSYGIFHCGGPEY